MHMRKIGAFCCTALLSVSLLAGCAEAPASTLSPSTAPATTSTASPDDTKSEPQKLTLNIVTAGDTNMEELQNNYVAPIAAEKFPGMTLNVVGAGAGDDGSRKIFDKLKAQKDAGKEKWDMDVAIVHQGIMGEMIREGLLEKYVPLTEIGQYLTSDGAKNSLGTDVNGYVIPLFMSQTALAYNTKKVENPPQTMDELGSWIKANPNKFGYNGVKGGMSGVAFVAGYLYSASGDTEQLTKGPYDKAIEDKWGDIMSALKALPVTATNGNQGTLDMLNRGEIDMGPVWVDMFYTMVAEGRMSPDVSLTLPEPGMPGQPMYIVVPAKAANKDAAIKFAELLGTPEVQAKVVVDKFNWYPGIDSSVVLPLCSDAAKESLFKDITPEILNKNGKVFPLEQYKSDMMEAYENAR